MGDTITINRGETITVRIQFKSGPLGGTQSGLDITNCSTVDVVIKDAVGDGANIITTLGLGTGLTRVTGTDGYADLALGTTISSEARTLRYHAVLEWPAGQGPSNYGDGPLIWPEDGSDVPLLVVKDV